MSTTTAAVTSKSQSMEKDLPVVAPRGDVGASAWKSLIKMREIAVDLEKQHKTQMVKELEVAYTELLEDYFDCRNLSSAVESVGNAYQPGQQPTDFKKLLDNEMAKSKSGSRFVAQKNQLLRQFKSAIWNVHNSGQPMPGEEQEDIVMTSTQSNLLNITCPLSGKPVTELSEPVRSMDCRHVYEKQAIMAHIRSSRGQSKCPMSACPKMVLADRVVCDSLLRIELDEWLSMNRQTDRTNIIEDDEEGYSGPPSTVPSVIQQAGLSATQASVSVNNNCAASTQAEPEAHPMDIADRVVKVETSAEPEAHPMGIADTGVKVETSAEPEAHPMSLEDRVVRVETRISELKFFLNTFLMRVNGSMAD